jgi:hypothetical protein
MTAFPDLIDHVLIPIDPVRALETITAELDTAISLDPKVRQAAQLMQERLEGVTDEDLGAVLWLHMRTRLQDARAPEAFRRAVGDSDGFLRSVELALGTGFTTANLQQSVREAQRVTAGDLEAKTLLDRARDELKRIEPAAEVAPLFGIAIAIACVCAGICYCIAAGLYALVSE